MPRKTHDGIRKRCACPRRQWPKCSHPWHFSFHHAGVEYRLSLDKLAALRGESAPTSKSDAVKWRDRLRNEIRDGINPEAPGVRADASTLTVGDVVARYLEKFVGKRIGEKGIEWSREHLRPKSAQQADYQLRIACACEVPAAGGTMRFDGKPIASVTKADIDAIRDARRPHGLVGCNRLLARLRHLFNWAITEGFSDTHPFRRLGVSVVKLEMKAEMPRQRRLNHVEGGIGVEWIGRQLLKVEFHFP